MVQVVPTGYNYIGGSRNCLKKGGEGGGVAAYHTILLLSTIQSGKEGL